MASNTSRLDLLKKDTTVDGSDTFNIKTMMNDNWDKIDKNVALIDPATGKLLPGQENPVDTSNLATKTELGNKVDKVAGKALSTNDYTTVEKNKLGAIEQGAQVNTVTTVAGRTGAVTLTKTDVGLSNVDNVKQASKVEHDTLSNSFETHKADYVKHPGYGRTTNVGNAYSLTLTPVPTAYVDGMGIVASINADSTGASSINVNGLGVIPLMKPNGQPVTNLKKDGIYPFRYNATTVNFIEQGGGGEDLTELIAITNAAERNEDAIRTSMAAAVTDKRVSTASNAPWVTIENNVKLIDTSGYLPGPDQVFADNTAPTSTSTVWVKIKEVTLGQSGTYRITLQVAQGDCQIYVNGVPTGAVRSVPGANYLPFTEDIFVPKGGALQFFYRRTSASEVFAGSIIIGTSKGTYVKTL